MRSLRELQLRFGASLLDPEAAYAASQVVGNGIDSATRLGFYRNNVVSNFRDALRATYCVVERLVGEQYFNRLSKAFFRAYPSRSGDLNRYGAEFAEFLSNHEVAAQLAYLPDVAKLERAMEESFYAGHRPRLELNALSSVPPDRQDRVTLELDPACRLLSSPYPVHRIWEVNQPNFSADDRVDLGEGRVFLLVRREHFEVVLEPLCAGAFWLLSALEGRAPLAESLAQAQTFDPDFDSLAFVQRHVQLGTFADFDWPLD